MKVFTSTSFRGRWPVGVSAIIKAPNSKIGKQMLLDELERVGLKQTEKDIADITLEEVDTKKKGVEILQDGDY